MTIRTIVLKTHLYLGLVAAVFLVILGLTGSIMAFEGDIDHWLHPGVWYVRAAGKALDEGDLIARVERSVAPVRVSGVQISPRPELAQAMVLSDRSTVLVNSYDGSILTRFSGRNTTDRVLGYIHQIHLRLAAQPGPGFAAAGKVIVSYAGLALCLLAPTGLFLWWRTKQASIRWDASFFCVCFDVHHVIGIYAGLFLFVAALTGVLIGFEFGEKMLYSLTNSERPARGRPPESRPSPGATPIGVARALAVAHQAMPTAFAEVILLPANPNTAYTFIMRVPEETSGVPHSNVSVDQYSGQVLQVHNFLTDSEGFRWIRFNRSIHTGDIWGLPGHILVSLSSLLLVAMVITGLVIWWKKLAV